MLNFLGFQREKVSTINSVHYSRTLPINVAWPCLSTLLLTLSTVFSWKQPYEEPDSLLMKWRQQGMSGLQLSPKRFSMRKYKSLMDGQSVLKSKLIQIKPEWHFIILFIYKWAYCTLNIYAHGGLALCSPCKCYNNAVFKAIYCMLYILYSLWIDFTFPLCRFVDCMDCGRKMHQICVLHNDTIWPSGWVFVILNIMIWLILIVFQGFPISPVCPLWLFQLCL